MSSTFAWIDAAGVEHSLAAFAENLETIEGVAGMHMPPVRVVRDQVAGQPGSRRRSTLHDTVRVTVPLFLQTVGEVWVDARLRQLERTFDPARGDGQLKAYSSLGDVRLLTCRYASGLELTEDEKQRFPGAAILPLVFEADDPYWYGSSELSQQWTPSAGTSFWFDSGTSKYILPISLLGDHLGNTTITNDGDVEAWPRWVVNGPGTTLTVTNTTTGRSFVWSGNIPTGSTLTIDTRPGVKTVQLAGSSAYDRLTAWDLWPLESGDNALDIDLSGTTVGVSAVSLYYTPRFLGP